MIPDEIVIEYDWAALNPIVLRQGKLPDTRLAHRIARQVGALNKCIREHHIHLHGTPPNPLLVKIGQKTREIRNSLELQFVVRRVFNRGDKGLKYGGRFYTAPAGGILHPQGLSKSCRKRLLIDGNETTRADFGAMHISQLYALEGVQLYEDPYTMIDGDREILKKMLLIAINAPSRASAIRAFRKATGEPGDDIYDAIVTAHPTISKYIGSDYGIRLQRLDSDIANLVLMHFTKKDKLCIPVHDEFIVERNLEGELLDVMHESYKKIMGGYDCRVEVC